MLRKVLAIFLLIIVTATCLLFLLKDYLFKMYAIHYFKKYLNSECRIEKVRLTFKSVQLENIRLSNKGIDLHLKRINIPFNVSKASSIAITGINLDDAALSIKTLEKIKEMFPVARTVKAGTAIAISALTFDFKNILIKLEKAHDINLDVSFSLKGRVENNNVILDSIEIYDANVPSDNFQMNHLTLKKYDQDLYRINISDIRIKNKTFKNIILPLKIKVNKIIFPRAKNILFGQEAYVKGILDFDHTGACFNADFESVSFENIMGLIAGEDSASIEGLFDGITEFCWRNNILVKLNGDFRNKTGGFINIKRETSFDFLRSYLDEPSYRVLIDNLKNYKYNRGTVMLGKEESDLIIAMNFNSEELGERNIAVNLHNILGGGK
jgi:hypothetical protein